MRAEQAYNLIEDTVIVAGMRGAFPPHVALPLVETLLEIGIRVFEFTYNSEQPIEAMQAVKETFGDSVCAGMGTVLAVEDAVRVMDAGADFIVSPAFQREIVQAVMARDILMAPGVATPSEAVAAWGMGVKLLKLFPIGALGIDYFKAMFGPLNHMRFMCNGAINDSNASEFIQAGAVAVGMAGWLTGDGTWPASRLRSRGQILKNAVAVARGDEPMWEA
ncbi:bifunctional 4-hydroxy-2-oxoglutarate aldolase/2-dehydro-3-deoxy-phosphogluconate aldolase [Phototrophicus methaneseepsis]|uniref:Bifunctional 4-hydroxy-2-oxoglutarate aldolase/2-dehydro-3-deoxy-phosphogluconate aldolase n=1 Tax=Phototrophicus methaneseepsis TaxID=2710758 RepID=A0A7S8E7Y9_9CHLR|nr:bifunctional 4-hydroxy-2-oxoglutarate aldolase/2-dehydro-3-deoxy-phosphogluconate aldolase [Phototrophicus methaneseepsis]QPC81953.1 bifunctional 4-hydroxy-2-oxoglutarate aldolase/2-dehydro-3-deoxy-phosphogluconate aldolase [Phototrophicus methaneseepsis]